MKLGKISYITCVDMESLIRKIYGCANNPEDSSTTKRVSIFLLDIQCWALCIWAFYHLDIFLELFKSYKRND